MSKAPTEEAYLIAEEAYGDAIELRALVELMRAQNSGGVNKALESKGAAMAAVFVRNSLIARIVVLAARAFAPPKEGDRHLARAFQLLNEPKVRSEFETRTGKEAVEAAIALWQKLKGDDRLHKIKHFRDKFTAHLGTAKDIPMPAFADLHAFANETAELMSALARATDARPEPISSWDKQISDASKTFWAPWTEE